MLILDVIQIFSKIILCSLFYQNSSKCEIPDGYISAKAPGKTLINLDTLEKLLATKQLNDLQDANETVRPKLVTYVYFEVQLALLPQ